MRWLIILLCILVSTCSNETNDDKSIDASIEDLKIAIPKIPLIKTPHAFSEGSWIDEGNLKMADIWFLQQSEAGRKIIESENLIDIYSKNLKVDGHLKLNAESDGNPNLPFLSLILEESNQTKQVKRNLGTLIKEYQFWMDGFFKLKKGTQRKNVIQIEEDIALNVYGDSLSADLVLNSLLYHLEKSIAQGMEGLKQDKKASHYSNKANQRRAAIMKLLFDKENYGFTDFNLNTGKSDVLSLESIYPVYVGLSPDSIEQVILANMVQALDVEIEKDQIYKKVIPIGMLYKILAKKNKSKLSMELKNKMLAYAEQRLSTINDSTTSDSRLSLNLLSLFLKDEK